MKKPPNYNVYINDSSLNIFNHFQTVKPFIDLIITSPPYWNMKNYGSIENQTGYGQSYKDYLNDIKSTFKMVYDISKDSATLYLNVDTMKRDGKVIRLPDDMARVLESIGWIHQDTIIWDKGKTLPWSRKGQMRNIFEYVLMFTKTTNYKYYLDRVRTVEELKEWWINYPERYNPKGKAPDNIWEFFIPTQGSWGSKKSYEEDYEDTEFKHACPFPPEMMARLILLSSDIDDVVFDPYAGTGILLATAEKMNRKYIGFDTNPNYKNIFEKITRPLINDKWEEIEAHYQSQEKLKEILQETILKLRILKFPKALIKKLRSLNKDDETANSIENNFSAIFAIQVPTFNLTENDDNIIGKAKFIFFWNDISTLEPISKTISEVASKAPFSKYGLDVEIEVIYSEEIENYIDKLGYLFYSYVTGNTISYHQELTKFELLNFLNTENYTDFFNKDIPPIFSNIKIHEDNYSMVPALKYEKRSLSK
ncbi:site-specific DNA-methyltransferase [Bacillus sp. V3-13]|uniref:DNA-methyltransferase n=1 Tax=Bacillus sp. V3-13 TaxID=2053728 RepID=UPI000C7632C3|nr:site-specific DNA-methyltransferase [Bacillus sp. V3-13]PLR75305.1 site-specific DNA-methyltransferase [Bacillus sp. V3-13]